MKEKKVLVLHGPNLNMLGIREPEFYGIVTLESINQELIKRGKQGGLSVECFQSNQEGLLVEKLQEAFNKFDYIIINAAAFTHYSIGIRDAIKEVAIPTIEVHMSNIDAREEFRKHSVIADVVVGRISGFGANSYFLALEAVKGMIKVDD